MILDTEYPSQKKTLMHLRTSSGRTTMKVNLICHNPALINIFEHPEQTITMDANLLIPPVRSQCIERGFGFSRFQKVWLDPIFAAFPNLAIHEAVYEELVMPSVQSYVQSMLDDLPPRLIIHRDASLMGKSACTSSMDLPISCLSEPTPILYTPIPEVL